AARRRSTTRRRATPWRVAAQRLRGAARELLRAGGVNEGASRPTGCLASGAASACREGIVGMGGRSNEGWIAAGISLAREGIAARGRSYEAADARGRKAAVRVLGGDEAPTDGARSLGVR